MNYSIKTENLSIFTQWKKEVYAHLMRYINFLHATGNHLTKELPLPSPCERKWTCREKIQIQLGTTFSPAALGSGHFTPASGGAAEAQRGPGKKVFACSNQRLGSPSNVTALETDCVIMIMMIHAKQTFWRLRYLRKPVCSQQPFWRCGLHSVLSSAWRVTPQGKALLLGTASSRPY